MDMDPKTTIDQEEPSIADLAQQFAAQVVQGALVRSLDGLNVFQELAQKPAREGAE